MEGGVWGNTRQGERKNIFNFYSCLSSIKKWRERKLFLGHSRTMKQNVKFSQVFSYCPRKTNSLLQCSVQKCYPQECTFSKSTSPGLLKSCCTLDRPQLMAATYLWSLDLFLSFEVSETQLCFRPPAHISGQTCTKLQNQHINLNINFLILGEK